MKNELLGKDEISINVGGVDFTASKIEEMIRSHTLQNTEAARLLRGRQIELDRVKGLLGECEGILNRHMDFLKLDPTLGGREILELLQKLKGGE